MEPRMARTMPGHHSPTDQPREEKMFMVRGARARARRLQLRAARSLWLLRAGGGFAHVTPMGRPRMEGEFDVHSSLQTNCVVWKERFGQAGAGTSMRLDYLCSNPLQLCFKKWAVSLYTITSMTTESSND